MGGRAKPNWAVFAGGPLDGQRELLPPYATPATLVRHTGAPAPGMRTPHEYQVTADFRACGFHEARSRVLRFLRSLPDEPVPPPLHVNMW